MPIPTTESSPMHNLVLGQAAVTSMLFGGALHYHSVIIASIFVFSLLTWGAHTFAYVQWKGRRV
jgi:hypothetical protein